jgi:uncharacterized iron-regulated membrane protein
MKKTLPQSMAWLHSWAGVIFGWVLFAIALTGTIAVFKPEVFGWMQPEARSTNAPIPAVVAAVKYLEEHADTSRPWRLFAPDDRSLTTRAFYYTREPGQNKPIYHDRALDAVTGKPDGIRDTKGGEFFYRFHFQLELPYPYGRALAVLAGVAMLVAIISGVLTHRRIFTDFFVFRPGAGKRNFLDAHNVMAVFALPFHIVITFSGVLTLVTLMFPWAMLANYGEDRAALEADLDPGHIHRPALKEPAALGDLAAMLKRAEAEFKTAGNGVGRIGRVAIENPGDKNATVTVEQHDGDNVAYSHHMVIFDGPTGDVLKVYKEEQTARRIYDTIYGLHLTRFANGVSRWMYFISGLLLSALIATGLIIWSLSRADHDTFVRRAVARLTAGTTMGLIMAVPVFFWANRLLPADDPARAQTEVAWFYITWAIGILWALIRHPRAAWAEQAALAALLYVTLPMASAVLTGRGLWAKGLNDPMFMTFDLVLTLTGLMFGALAFYLNRSRAARPALQPALAS